MEKLLATFWLRTLLLAALFGGLVIEAQAQESTDLQQAVGTKSGEIKAFQDALAELESANGAYAQALPEQLYSLGLALQETEQHEEAITTFKHGIHLTRINQGLYSLEQIPFIKAEINSNLIIGELTEADQRHSYLLTVQQHSLPIGESLTLALMQHADWQLQAYELDIEDSETNFDRLQEMWELYRTAIRNILTKEDPTSHALLLPLKGLLKTQYLIAADQSVEWNQEDKLKSQWAHLDRGFMQSYKMGKAVINSIYEVELASHGDHSLQVAQAGVMLGDWHLWNGKTEAAGRAYHDAVKELSQLKDAKIQMGRIFGMPVPLPDIDGLRRLPPTVEPDEGNVLLEFGIDNRGHVFDIVRLDQVDSNEDDNNEKEAKRLMRRIKKLKFRPRYEDQEAVITENIQWAYVL